jgi:DNA-binding NarL/FixJ family response regulator
MKGLPRQVPLSPRVLSSLSATEAEAARRFALAYGIETRLGTTPNPMAPGLESVRRVIRHTDAAVRRGQPTAGLGLTRREYQVMSLVRDGWTNTTIARVLFVSPHTVRTHLENVFEKLEVSTRTAAVTRVFGESEGDRLL